MEIIILSVQVLISCVRPRLLVITPMDRSGRVRCGVGGHSLWLLLCT